jgi:hypothetical protein
MLLPLDKPGKVARQRLELVAHPRLLDLDALVALWAKQVGYVLQTGVAREVVGDVGRDGPGEREEVFAVYRLYPVECILSCVVLAVGRPAPGRTEKHNVDLPPFLLRQRACELNKVGSYKLDSVLDAIYACVVPRKLEPGRVDVERNDALAGECERDGIAADAAEGVEDDVGAAAGGDVGGDAFGCD